MAATQEHPRRLTLRLSDHDLAEVQRAARAQGTSVQRYVMALLHEDLVRREHAAPELDSWDAVRALQRRVADGSASAAEREAFFRGEGYDLDDEDRSWLSADLTGLGNDPELDHAERP